ncbi:MAG: flagellar basal body rod protein FlgB [Clostridium sp.]
MPVQGLGTYDLVKQGIDASALRGKNIANNIANVNTKGYKKFDVVFEDNINGNNNSLKLKTTKDKHINPNSMHGENIEVVKDESTSMRMDGNNVDIDIEKVNQATNTLKYNALIQRANGILSSRKYVISGGRG